MKKDSTSERNKEELAQGVDSSTKQAKCPEELSKLCEETDALIIGAPFNSVTLMA